VVHQVVHQAVVALPVAVVLLAVGLLAVGRPVAVPLLVVSLGRRVRKADNRVSQVLLVERPANRALGAVD
jgi:hypothetical protein